ncbi:MAG: hypothetical protein MUF04_09205, partial [Akkermansiaceae bacterium]|nr:hypothetical protein [Akkermansiaceae bacterium]
GLDPAVEAVQVLVAVQATMPAPATGAAPSAAPAALRLAISPNQHPADPARIAACVGGGLGLGWALE